MLLGPGRKCCAIWLNGKNCAVVWVQHVACNGWEGRQIRKQDEFLLHSSLSMTKGKHYKYILPCIIFQDVWVHNFADRNNEQIALFSPPLWSLGWRSLLEWEEDNCSRYFEWSFSENKNIEKLAWNFSGRKCADDEVCSCTETKQNFSRI